MKKILFAFIIAIFALGFPPNEVIARIQSRSDDVKKYVLYHYASFGDELLDFYNEYSKKLKHWINEISNNKVRKLDSHSKKYYPDRTELIAEALSWMGTRYRYGGNSKNGIDCSAYVQKVYQSQGIQLPRTARGQFKASRNFAKRHPLPGDVVYFHKNNKNSRIVHCGIVLPGGKFIHASEGKKNVVISSLWDPIYKNRIAGYRGIINAAN